MSLWGLHTPENSIFHHPSPVRFTQRLDGSVATRLPFCDSIFYYRWWCQKTVTGWVDVSMPANTANTARLNHRASASHQHVHYHTDLKKQSSASSWAQCKTFCCEQTHSRAEQLSCLWCSESASLSFVFMLLVWPSLCHRCFNLQQCG